MHLCSLKTSTRVHERTREGKVDLEGLMMSVVFFLISSHSLRGKEKLTKVSNDKLTFVRPCFWGLLIAHISRSHIKSSEKTFFTNSEAPNSFKEKKINFLYYGRKKLAVSFSGTFWGKIGDAWSLVWFFLCQGFVFKTQISPSIFMKRMGRKNIYVALKHIHGHIF